MKKDEMIGEIAKRLNVRLDPDDPAFVLLEMMQIMLEAEQKKINDASSTATGKLIEQTAALLAAVDKMTSAVNEINLMARGIVIFAGEEQAKIQANQKASQKESSNIFMHKLKENTASFKSQLWLIMGLVGFNFLTTLTVILFFATKK
jgi:cobalamin biosynthesis Mg chelatase CobN